jgi:hypothetical protein
VFHALSGIRTHDPSFRASEDSNSFNYLEYVFTILNNRVINKNKEIQPNVQYNKENTERQDNKTHIKFHKAMAVLILIFGSEIWTKTEAKIGSAEIN